MFKRISVGLLLVLVLPISLMVFWPAKSSAFFFEPRSIKLGSGTPSVTTTHNFTLEPASPDDIGSLTFTYCSNTPLEFDSCTVPAGLDVSSANLTNQTGNTGFTIDSADSTANKIVLSRATSPGLMALSSYDFDNIINPSTPGQTVFVRLASFASNDGTGSIIDKGGVAFAVQAIFNVGAFVPPFLQLCVAITVSPDCSTIVGDSIDLGILSSQHANTGQSQLSTATNDPGGYDIFALGNTMTSGNNVIQNIPVPAASFPGTPQFGINLRANLLPPVGQDPVGLGTGLPTANYNTPNRFVYNDGDMVASSPLNTNYNRMTVSYLVNIPSKQAAGVYATTITYVATVQF